MITKEDFQKISNDVNGNPRYIIYWHDLNTDPEKAEKMQKAYAGKKYQDKDNPGWIIFSTYNLNSLIEKLNNYE